MCVSACVCACMRASARKGSASVGGLVPISPLLLIFLPVYSLCLVRLHFPLTQCLAPLRPARTVADRAPGNYNGIAIQTGQEFTPLVQEKFLPSLDAMEQAAWKTNFDSFTDTVRQNVQTMVARKPSLDPYWSSDGTPYCLSFAALIHSPTDEESVEQTLHFDFLPYVSNGAEAHRYALVIINVADTPCTPTGVLHSRIPPPCDVEQLMKWTDGELAQIDKHGFRFDTDKPPEDCIPDMMRLQSVLFANAQGIKRHLRPLAAELQTGEFTM